MQIQPLLSSAYHHLAVPNILPLGNAQINLALRSLIRIFDFVEDTAPRKKMQVNLLFSLGLFVLWLRRRYFVSEKMQASLLFSLDLFVSLPFDIYIKKEIWLYNAE
ncbi:MAG: hypothetical protein J6K38_09305 [Alistipes sp.]|nr:hypothetical protein [Alistipes sp.]